MQTEINRYSITLNMLGTPITETMGRDKEKGIIFMAVYVGNIGNGLGGEGARFTLKMLTTPITETRCKGK